MAKKKNANKFFPLNSLMNEYSDMSHILNVDRSKGWLHLSTPPVFEYCERLVECFVGLRYACFLTAIVFWRIDNTWDFTSGIRVDVMGSNLRGVAGEEIVGRSENLLRLSNFF